MKLWGRKCAVTGCDIQQVLIASHAKPWAESSNNERLDAYNGLLLSAHVDKLFDSGLISFSDKGELLISEEVDDASLAALGLSRKSSLRFVKKEHIPYLAAHRARNDF
jgi:predicted restriction endonuclease